MLDENEAMLLKMIEQNEDNQEARLIYSDFLEERGRVDESMRQRNWIAAKQELIDILELSSDTTRQVPSDPFYDLDRDDYYEGRTTFKQFIEMLNENAEGSDYIRFGNRETLMSHYHENIETVWRLWSIITGRPSPISLPYGGCAC